MAIQLSPEEYLKNLNSENRRDETQELRSGSERDEIQELRNEVGRLRATFQKQNLRYQNLGYQQAISQQIDPKLIVLAGILCVSVVAIALMRK